MFTKNIVTINNYYSFMIDSIHTRMRIIYCRGVKNQKYVLPTRCYFEDTFATQCSILCCEYLIKDVVFEALECLCSNMINV